MDENKKKKENEQQQENDYKILVEDGTMAALGYSNPTEVSVPAPHTGH